MGPKGPRRVQVRPAGLVKLASPFSIRWSNKLRHTKSSTGGAAGGTTRRVKGKRVSLSYGRHLAGHNHQTVARPYSMIWQDNLFPLKNMLPSNKLFFQSFLLSPDVLVEHHR